MNTTRRGFLGGLLALAAIPLAKKAKPAKPARRTGLEEYVKVYETWTTDGRYYSKWAEKEDGSFMPLAGYSRSTYPKLKPVGR